MYEVFRQTGDPMLHSPSMGTKESIEVCHILLNGLGNQDPSVVIGSVEPCHCGVEYKDPGSRHGGMIVE